MLPCLWKPEMLFHYPVTQLPLNRETCVDCTHDLSEMLWIFKRREFPCLVTEREFRESHGISGPKARAGLWDGTPIWPWMVSSNQFGFCFWTELYPVNNHHEVRTTVPGACERRVLPFYTQGSSRTLTIDFCRCFYWHCCLGIWLAGFGFLCFALLTF